MSHTSLFEGRDLYHEAQPGNRHVLASQWCVGATLKSAREAGGETLEEVAESVRIRVDYLAAIEDENYYGLPGWAHAVGYVRSYAMYLGLDSAPLVKKVRDQLALREHVFAQQADERTGGLARLASMGGVVLLLGLIGFGLVATGTTQSVAAFVRLAPEKIMALADSVWMSANPPKSPTYASAKTDAVPPPARNLPPAEEKLPQAEEKIQFAATTPSDNAPLQRSLVTGPIISLNASGVAPGDGTGVFVIRPLPRHSIDRGAASYGQVTLRARDSVWFRVEDSQGGIVAERKMARGEVQRLPNVRGLTIATRDGGALEYYVNGTFAGVLGNQGKPVRGLSLAKLAVQRAGG